MIKANCRGETPIFCKLTELCPVAHGETIHTLAHVYNKTKALAYESLNNQTEAHKENWQKLAYTAKEWLDNPGGGTLNLPTVFLNLLPLATSLSAHKPA